MTLKRPLSQNGMLPWKQWILVSAVVGGSFMAGTNFTGLLHVFNGEIHQTVAEKEKNMNRLLDPVKTNQSTVMLGQALLDQRFTAHEAEATRRFGELGKQLDAILLELRKR